MDEKLQRITRELRHETCPPRVIERVARRIDRPAPRPLRFRYGIAVALGTLVLTAGVLLWRWQGSQNFPASSNLVQRTESDPATIADQAGGALAYIGQILLEAGAQSGDAILTNAVPPLRQGLEIAKNNLMNQKPL